MKPAMVFFMFLVTSSSMAGQDATVRLEPLNPQGTRELQKQTADAVIRDYLQSWQNLQIAFQENRPGPLEQGFVGTALDKLKDTIEQQGKLGIRTRYQDRAHDLRVDFYSPDGLSVRLIDNVDYEQQTFEHDTMLATERVQRRYVVVLTPSEVRWRVRIFQSEKR